jgi:hypothetical protein
MMMPTGEVGPLLAAAYAPAAGAAFVARQDGTLDLYGYPLLASRWQRYTPDQPAYRLAVDTRRDRLFAAVSSPEGLHFNRFGDTPVGRGGLQVYDFHKALEARRAQQAAATLAPLGYLLNNRQQTPLEEAQQAAAAVASYAGLAPGCAATALAPGLVAVGAAEVAEPARQPPGAAKGGPVRPVASVPLNLSVSELLYSEAHDCVYYLATGAGGVVVGRVPAADVAAARQVLLPGAHTLCLSPDGGHIYAAGERSVWELDPASGKVLRLHVIEGVVTDMGVDEHGRAVMIDQGRYPSVTILDVRGSRGQLHRVPPHILGPLYLRLAPSGNTAYLCGSSPFGDALFGLPIQLDPLPPTGLMAGRLPRRPGTTIRGEFFLSPDGRVIITRTGQVYHLQELPSEATIPRNSPFRGGASQA